MPKKINATTAHEACCAQCNVNLLKMRGRILGTDFFFLLFLSPLEAATHECGTTEVAAPCQRGGPFLDTYVTSKKHCYALSADGREDVTVALEHSLDLALGEQTRSAVNGGFALALKGGVKRRGAGVGSGRTQVE